MDKLIQGARQLGIDLNSRQLEQYQVYFEELAKWNEKFHEEKIQFLISIGIIDKDYQDRLVRVNSYIFYTDNHGKYEIQEVENLDFQDY